jgi:3-phenylpropionate/trans-cinnamate dioxygenase ferredoxin reductase component
MVIVGASLAGASAAAALREEGFEGRVVLIGDEPVAPYERPPLSKEYLRDQSGIEKLFVRPDDYWSANAIETHFGALAIAVDPANRLVELEGGEQVRYDKLLIATGAQNIRPPIQGIDLEGVVGLRTLEDANRIKKMIRPGSRAVIVGMGFIGAEVAASLNEEGLEVTVVEILKTPLARAVGEEIGKVIEGIHRDEGVKMFFEDSVVAFEGAGSVERAVTAKGRALECDFALIAAGVRPATDFLDGSGIAMDNGVVVDELSRTSVEGVFAAGDVCNHYHPLAGRHMRVEHWQNALRQGSAAARSMLGKGSPYDEVHWFWSDQYEHNLQQAGFGGSYDQTVVRGRMAQREFAVFYLSAGRLVSATGLNRGKDIRAAVRLIRDGKPLDPTRLADPLFDLRKSAR